MRDELQMTKLFLKILYRLKILKFLNLSVKVNGLKIPIIGELGYENVYGTEKWMSDILKLLVAKSKVVFWTWG